MAPSDSLELVCRRYANELAAAVPVHDPAVREAFAIVPRERFLGPAPWTLVTVTSPQGETTSDPVRLYQDVLVAIDPKWGLNNGEPKLWARLFDRPGVRPGERVVHVGNGTPGSPLPSLHRLPGRATPTRSAGQAPGGATTSAALTFTPDHSVGAVQSCRQTSIT